MWALGDQGQGNPAKTTKPLVQVQHKSLRLVTGAFKATAGAGLEREVDTAPVPLYTQFLARKYARETDSLWLLPTSIPLPSEWQIPERLAGLMLKNNRGPQGNALYKLSKRTK